MQLQISLGVALADLCAGRAELTIPDEFSFGRVEKLSGLILPFDARLAIYRVVQEGINNAEKKGTATRIVVSLETKGTSVRVTVFDNGHFLPEKFSSSFGLSLVDAYTSANRGTWSLSNVADGVNLEAEFSDVLYPITDVVPTTLNDLKKST
jgi:signal transduction histidine kinase